MLEAVVFYTLAAVLVGLALLVITRTNPIASALGLVGAFAALAGLYALLSASLVAILQVLVYAGGIMVLMVFVIMLLNLAPEDLAPLKARMGPVFASLAGVAVLVLAPLALDLTACGAMPAPALVPGFGSLVSVGETVFSRFLFPFEMLSLLLLAAVVGAIVLSKRKL